MKLVLFDIDGTLLNTAGAGRRAIAMALHQLLGLSAISAEYRFDGKTDRQIVGDLLRMAGHPNADDELEIDRVCAHYVALLADELRSNPGAIRVFPGVNDLLDEVDAHHDCTLGLLTGNVLEGARLKLASAGVILERFPVGAFGSDDADRLKLPAVAKARGEAVLRETLYWTDLVIIGDTPADVACARQSGSRSIAVSTGSFGSDALRSAGAHYVFESLADTCAVMDAVLA